MPKMAAVIDRGNMRKRGHWSDAWDSHEPTTEIRLTPSAIAHGKRRRAAAGGADPGRDRISVHRKQAAPDAKPTAALRPLIEVFCPADGTVLDPSAGSGSSLVAAKLKCTPLRPDTGASRRA